MERDRLANVGTHEAQHNTGLSLIAPAPSERRSGKQRKRLRWAINIFLLLLAMWLLPPTRSWLDQFIARQMDPHLHVSGLRWHPRPFVAEMRHFDWKPAHARHGLSISGERAWFAVDANTLLNAKVVAPRVVVQNARLRVDAPQTLPDSLLNVWQASMEKRINGLGWHNAASRFEEKLGEVERGTDWMPRVENWLARSTALARQATDQRQATVSLDNPLRVQTEQQRVLERMQSLAQQQASVQQQFTLLMQLLDAKLKRIDEQFMSESIALARQFKEQAAQDDAMQDIASQLVITAARNAWSDLLHLARVGDALCQAEWGPGSTAGTSYRRDPSWIEFREVAMDARLVLPLTAHPVEITGRYRRPQDNFAESSWRMIVHTISPMQVEAHNRAGCPARTLLTVASATETAGLESTELAVRLELECDAQTLRGKLRLHPADWQSMIKVPEGNTIDVTMTGNWDAVQFAMSGELPEWYTAAIQQALTEENQREQSRILSSLRDATQKQKAELLRLSEQLRRNATALDSHQSEIAACETALRDYFQELDRDYEFARLKRLEQR